MSNSDYVYKLGAQIAGLEMVVKTMIAMHFASRVKDETGFAKAADQVRTLAQHLQDHIGSSMSAAPDGPVRELMESEVRASVRRCFEDAESQLTTIAQLILAVSDPASEATN